MRVGAKRERKRRWMVRAAAFESCWEMMARQREWKRPGLGRKGKGPMASIHLDEDPAERDFLATGSGPWADFLDRLAGNPSLGVPAEDMVRLHRLGLAAEESIDTLDWVPVRSMDELRRNLR